MKTRVILLLVCACFWQPALAIEAWIVGAQLGTSSGPSSTANYGLGFGVDIGVKNNPAMDVILSVSSSTHGGTSSASMTSGLITADVHFLDLNDFDLSVGGGPGLYSYSSGATSVSGFGLQAGGNADVIINQSVRLGLALKYHYLFAGSSVTNFWTGALRVAYLFGVAQ